MAEYFDMRDFMVLAGQINGSGATQERVDEAAEVAVVVHPMVADLHAAVFKLRAFMETVDGDFGLGVDTGMQRAADMIDAILARHEASRPNG